MLPPQPYPASHNSNNNRAQRQRSHPHPAPNPSLVNRLSQPQPGSKKAKKRRRKADRLAREEARLQGVNWLNNLVPNSNNSPPSHIPGPFPPPVRTGSSWRASESRFYNYDAPGPSSLMRVPSPPSAYEDYDYPTAYPAAYSAGVYDETLYDNYLPDSMSPRAPTPHLAGTSTIADTPIRSDWVSSMAMAAGDAVVPSPAPHRRDMGQDRGPEQSHWSPLSAQTSLPPVQPPPMPPPSSTIGLSNTATQSSRIHNQVYLPQDHHSRHSDNVKPHPTSYPNPSLSHNHNPPSTSTSKPTDHYIPQHHGHALPPKPPPPPPAQPIGM
ncbi:hypothetical protein GALMADRAFT_242473, partial [Galerina marginata CBS 339.88]